MKLTFGFQKTEEVSVKSVIQKDIEISLVNPGRFHAGDAFVLELGEHFPLIVDFVQLFVLN